MKHKIMHIDTVIRALVKGKKDILLSDNQRMYFQ